MVGSISEPTFEDDLNLPSKLKTSNELLDPSEPKTNYLSFADSFLDFDSMKDWFEDNPIPDRIGSVKIEIEEDSFEKIHVPAPFVNESDSVVGEREAMVDGSGFVVKVEAVEHEELGNSSRLMDHVAGPIVSNLVYGEREAIVDGSGFMVKVEAADNEQLRNSSLIDPAVGSIVKESNHVFGVSEMNGSDFVLKSEAAELKELGNSSCLIEEEMEKVSLAGESGSLATIDENDAKREVETHEDESGCSSESESTSSSSSDSSNSDHSDSDSDAAVKVKEVVEVAGEAEEGEIRDDDGNDMVYTNDGGDDDDDDDTEDIEKMVCWSDVDDEDDGHGATKGPIKSKNELQDLPLVPSVDVTLQPSHQLLPVGVVLSMIGAQVIVEGVENHNPLNEGSILWITERRSPLGLIDELFGPVKNPYYVVRYNSESELPAGIHEGTLISFVQEFANHVLNDKNLYNKGYDASGENDEEISEEAEFSDDEKEAEYKRMLKMSKRGTNDQKPVNMKNNRKKVKNRDGNWKNGKPSAQQTPPVMFQSPSKQNQHHVSAVAQPSQDHGPGGTGMAPPFSHSVHTNGVMSIPPSGWMNGMSFQQSQNVFVPNGFPSQGMATWFSQNPYQMPMSMPMQSRMPFQQQFNPRHQPVVLQGGQSNFFPGPTGSPWPGLVGQDGFNQTLGMGLQGQYAHPVVNVGGQVNLPNGSHAEPNCNFQPPPGTQGNNEATGQFNQGASNIGRKPHTRGGSRYGRGRGRRQSR